MYRVQNSTPVIFLFLKPYIYKRSRPLNTDCGSQKIVDVNTSRRHLCCSWFQDLCLNKNHREEQCLLQLAVIPECYSETVINENGPVEVLSIEVMADNSDIL